ncbi:MAG: DNA-3-methyladenine glycosylase [Chloroflexi bacterium]|nr:MAG: DNA-3-methyladenine glycosylase [Chloroflexota bacterium]
MPLSVDFFNRPTLDVARDLLGQRLVRMIDGRRVSGRIVETEAYVGPHDTASHASKGRTPRTEVMFGPPGRAYVYLIYGMYHMLNLVTEAEGFPAAVLIRAIEPLEGLEVIQANRAGIRQARLLTGGPGRLCRALQIDLSLNRWDVTRGERLWLEPDAPVPPAQIARGPRVGIAYAQPKDRAAAWRFWIKDNPFVSR